MKKMSLAALAVCFATFAFAQEAVEVKAPEAPKSFTCADCGKTVEMKMPKFNRAPRGEMKKGEMPRGPRGPRPEMKKGDKRGPRPEMKEFKPRCKDCFKAKMPKAPVAPVEATPAQ